MKAIEYIKGALRILQVMGEDVTLSDAEADNALQALNMMLESWSNDSLLVYSVTAETFTLTASHNPHTWADGEDFNSDRPVRFLAAKVVKGDGTEQPLPVLSYNDYAEITDKTLEADYPEYIYYDNAWPTGNVYLYPVANDARVVRLYSEKKLQTADNLQTDLSFPPGWDQAIKYNLALRIAPEYQLTAGADVAQLAEEALLLIGRNSRHVTTDIVSPILNQQLAQISPSLEAAKLGKL